MTHNALLTPGFQTADHSRRGGLRITDYVRGDSVFFGLWSTNFRPWGNFGLTPGGRIFGLGAFRVDSEVDFKKSTLEKFTKVTF